MITVPVILLAAALILFILVAANVSGGKVNLLGAGLACWILAQLYPLIAT